MKTCTKCKTPKALECFSKDKYAKDGLDFKCKECKAGIYAEIPKDERRKWRREYYLDHQEHELALCAVYREANKDAREAYLRQYYINNPAKGAAKTAKYRASKLKATPSWLTKEQLLEIVGIYEKCPDGYHVDHIIPLQGKTAKGLHVPWNLQHLPAKENQRKSNRVIPAKSA